VHVIGGGGAACDECRKGERTDVGAAVGRRWQLGRPWASAAPPTPLPSCSSPTAPVCVDEETGGVGRQLGRLRGPDCPLCWHLDTRLW
jgi:hypothetical protein